MDYTERVYRIVKKIPRGKVMSYSQVGRILGIHPRAVAAALRMNKDPIRTPCYKVVHSDMRLGGYSCRGGEKLKEKLLKKDGIVIREGIVDKSFMMEL